MKLNSKKSNNVSSLGIIRIMTRNRRLIILKCLQWPVHNLSMSNGPYNFIYLDIGGFGLFYDKKLLQPQLYVKKEFKALEQTEWSNKMSSLCTTLNFCNTI